MLSPVISGGMVGCASIWMERASRKNDLKVFTCCLESEGHSFISGQVVIVGGGVAGLEALLALRALAGDRVAVTLVSQDDWFVDRPLTVAEPFGLGSAARYSLPEIAAEFDAEFVHATVTAVALVRLKTGSAVELLISSVPALTAVEPP